MTFQTINGRPTTTKKLSSIRRYGVNIAPSLISGETVTDTEVTVVRGDMAVSDKQFIDGVLSARLGPSTAAGSTVSVKFSWTTDQGYDYEIIDFVLSKE